VQAASEPLSTEEFAMSADEIVKTEKSRIARFMALGFGRYEAIRAVEDSLDLRSARELRDRDHALDREARTIG
jgi:hypothetical protein